MQTEFFTIIELTGHLIDSLTLAKVIDKIQHQGCHYQINDLQIGEKKNDISTAQISLWATSQQALDAMLAELKPYGALPIEEHEIKTKPCPDNGVVPPDAYVRHNPPIEVLQEGRWINVDRKGSDMVIVVSPERKTAHLQTVDAVKKGDLVVTGLLGVKVLPALGEASHVQAAAG